MKSMKWGNLLEGLLRVRMGVRLFGNAITRGQWPYRLAIVMVMISNRKLALIFEIRSLHYPVIHVHVAKALSQILSKSKLTTESKERADITTKSYFSYLTTLYYIGSISKNEQN